MKISVLIMCHNSQQSIARTLESVQGFDEVIVLDSGSNDETLQIVRSFSNVTLIQNKFLGFSKQRNYLLDHATNDWCLFVDSDEAVTKSLRDELYKIIGEGPKFKLYAVKRTEYLDGKAIESGFGASSYQDRFINKQHTTYQGEIHEYPLIDGVRHHYDSKERGHLPEHARLLHWPEYSVESALPKIAYYSKIKAHEKIKNGRTTNASIVILSFIGTLIKVWIKSIKEGKRGFLMAFMEATHRSMLKAIMYEQQMIQEERSSSKNN